jgi:hypothetical protein
MPWVVAKWVALVGFAATIVGLALRPSLVLPWLWYGLVPLLPASFLINAELWRNVCPFATLNTITGDERVGRVLDRRGARIATLLGIGLLLVAIPARLLILNESATATAGVLSLMGVAALVSGIPFQRKAGFCNSVCPILPVERLYGQRPMLVTKNARCTPCQACTRAGCYDLSPDRSALKVMRSGASAAPWMLQPFGAFALAFPGVIAAYYVMPRGWTERWWQTGGALICAGVVTWILGSTTFRATRTGTADGLLATAALSAAVFYWFTPPAMVAALSLPSAAATLLRFAGLGLVLLWTIRALDIPSRARAALRGH